MSQTRDQLPTRNLDVTVWSADRAEAADYASRRLAGIVHGLDLAAFGVVWANMRHGHRVGELRALPRLADALDEWLAEERRRTPVGSGCRAPARRRTGRRRTGAPGPVRRRRG
ncbi:hypothetical protein AB0G02_33250 [Actinosynnema sp. NPDC023658]|uniref:hypothetical protein n=1 Tax=Actinosynnema sp. NPDC023658 TaxID=3155465 RepID=UPI0033F18F82